MTRQRLGVGGGRRGVAVQRAAWDALKTPRLGVAAEGRVD
jgi:hypothetical protein